MECCTQSAPDDLVHISKLTKSIFYVKDKCLFYLFMHKLLKITNLKLKNETEYITFSVISCGLLLKQIQKQ